jgi:DNA-binding protein H-NS
LTLQDLGLGSAGPARKTRGPGKKKKVGAKRASARKSLSPPKFRDAAGHTWSGHGRRPNWYLAALAQGKTAADMAV